ncbi:MAG: ABC transporter ATP-binding protein [Actinomycetota bacterium]|nr:ABC transporter ATP-binding protein [Actinomycetota bacterium]
MAELDVVLSVDGLCSGYGKVGVLEDVSLAVGRGELVTLIGSNGAGKSTLLKTIVGMIGSTCGTVTFEGSDITKVTPERAVRLGMALVPEGRLLFGSMSVAENLELGAYSLSDASDVAAAWDRVHGLFPVLGERADQSAETLSGGEQQMLAVGRALMASPRMLLLDEPSLGLAPKVVAEIFAALDVLRSSGMTILLVEQDARLALKHADRGYVMRTGSVALSGTAEELLANDDVRLIYLGGWHGDEKTGAAAPPE